MQSPQTASTILLEIYILHIQLSQPAAVLAAIKDYHSSVPNVLITRRKEAEQEQEQVADIR